MTEMTDPDLCARRVIDAVGKDIRMAVPIGIGKPVRLLNALYGLALADRSIRLRIFTGLTLVRPAFRSDVERRFVGPLLDRLFPTWPDIAYAEAMRSKALPPNVEVHEFFMQAGQWLSAPLVQQSYVAMNYRHVAAHLCALGVNVSAQLVAPASDPADGRVSLSSNTDITLDLAPYIASRRASGAPMLTLGELNANLPFMGGEAAVARSEFDVLLAPPGAPYDLFAPPKEPVSLADMAMGLYAAALVKDGGTLQIGIGSFADALTHALILRHTRNADFRRLLADLGAPLPDWAEITPFSQGLYGCSEMLVDGFLALARAGILTRRVTDARTSRTEHDGPVLHAGFFLGSNAFYRELREMTADERDRFAMTAISFTNALLGETESKLAQRRDARFINTAMVATMLGAVSADQLEDGRVVSGIGGQCDFAEMAADLPGARAVTAVRAIRSGPLGRVQSNIVARYANTSIPRQFRDCLVTEYGVADLKGRSDREVVSAIVSVADRAFQARLAREATASGKLPVGWLPPAHATRNTSDHIARVLRPARVEGLLPVFPLGTEMTHVEQMLVPALQRLRAAGVADLVTIAWRGAGGSARAAAVQQLERLNLTAPRSLREHVMRMLVAGAVERA